MAQNFLQLNQSKSAVVLFSPEDIKVITNNLGNSSTNMKFHVKHLDVMFVMLQSLGLTRWSKE